MGARTGSHLRTDPLIRKVRSGAVNNASQLEKPLNLNLIIWVIRSIPQKERSKSVDKRK